MEFHSKQNIQQWNFFSVELLNDPFGSCSFTNLRFLYPDLAHFDCIISPPFFLLKIFQFKFLVFFLHFTQ